MSTVRSTARTQHTITHCAGDCTEDASVHARSRCSRLIVYVTVSQNSGPMLNTVQSVIPQAAQPSATGSASNKDLGLRSRVASWMQTCFLLAADIHLMDNSARQSCLGPALVSDRESHP
eukprot:gnl/TRDRNA2_/TRDRNA2_177117_c0_seq5.p1 gnl/TRDRNA2_/TRDRNA2_177117_c0~~gnl/TRDRNA2_/TRDRNA2_177117_c0_seq5.p1  ORF type:complete len:119 (-),score=0.42 gnl/TRDRNA2_/TRDRNA2_177117_c0_seq5:189-545(-)